MNVTHRIRMDLNGREPRPWIRLPQGDVLTRKLRMALFTGPVPWQIPEDIRVGIRCRLPGGGGLEYDTLSDGALAWQAEGNELTLTLAEELLARPGTAVLDAVLIRGEQVLHTFSAELRITAPEEGAAAAGNVPRGQTGLTGFLPAPDRAAEGQYFRAAKVSESGRVLRVEAVDAPAGGSVDAEAVRQSVDAYLAENPPAPGAEGKSAYAAAVEGGYTGTEAGFAEKLASEPRAVFYVEVTGSNGVYSADRDNETVAQAIAAGQCVICRCTMSESGDGVSVAAEGLLLPLLLDMGGIYLFGAYTGTEFIMALLQGEQTQVMWVQIATKADIPRTLPNPSALTFQGAVSATYDGTRGVTVTIPEAFAPETEETIPDYWLPALEQGAADIQAALEAAGRNKSAFLWYTDAHWGYGSGRSPALLAWLQAHTGLNRVNFGGDIANDYEYPDTGKTDGDWMALMRQWRQAVRDLRGHHSVAGNHDHDGTVAGLSTDKALYGFLMAPEEGPEIHRGGDFYYYIDEPNECTRYLYLSTGGFSVSDAQARFVIDALAGAPEGWHIVAISHIWFLYEDTAAPTVGSVPEYCRKLLALFDACNARESGSVTMNSSAIAYDFTGAGGRVEFCIGGHIHVDHELASDGGIPVILTETDSRHTRGASVYTEGTTAEASVSGIVADYDNRKLSVIRVGRGESREVALTAAAYTNVLDTVGFTENIRLSASGGYVETANTGTDLTGYISVKDGDVVCLKNVTMPDENGYTNKVYFFNSAKTGVNSISMLSSLTAKGVVYDGENLARFTVLGTDLGETSGASGYIRIGAADISSQSVITVNQLIN